MKRVNALRSVGSTLIAASLMLGVPASPAMAVSSVGVETEAYPDSQNPIVVQVQGVYDGTVTGSVGELASFSCIAVAPQATSIRLDCAQASQPWNSSHQSLPVAAAYGTSSYQTSRICYVVTAYGGRDRTVSGCATPIFIPEPTSPTAPAMLLGRTVPDASGYAPELVDDAMQIANLVLESAGSLPETQLPSPTLTTVTPAITEVVTEAEALLEPAGTLLIDGAVAATDLLSSATTGVSDMRVAAPDRYVN